jgi:hypothetical protein
LDDGVMLVNMIEPIEQIRAWYRITAGDGVADMVVLKDNEEDAVYYVVDRTIESVAVKYLERFTLIRQCRGDSDSRHLDSHVTYTSPGTTVLTGLDHLEAETVTCWADGQNRGTYTVASGSITIDSSAYTDVCVGLVYTAQYKTVKLGIMGNRGTTMMQSKRVVQIGLMARNVVPEGFQFGSSFTRLRDLPLVRDGQTIDSGLMITEFDDELVPFEGTWNADARVCIELTAPATIQAMVYQMEQTEK